MHDRIVILVVWRARDATVTSAHQCVFRTRKLSLEWISDKLNLITKCQNTFFWKFLWEEATSNVFIAINSTFTLYVPSDLNVGSRRWPGYHKPRSKHMLAPNFAYYFNFSLIENYLKGSAISQPSSLTISAIWNYSLLYHFVQEWYTMRTPCSTNHRKSRASALVSNSMVRSKTEYGLLDLVSLYYTLDFYSD